MLYKFFFALSLCLSLISAPAVAATDADSSEVIDATVGILLDDIKRNGVDALLYGEDFESNREIEQAFAKVYDASMSFLAYGINVNAATEEGYVKCGVRLDRHDTNLHYRRSDILRNEADDYNAGAKFYFSVTKHW